MNFLLSHFLDFLFPPTPEELQLRQILPEEIFTRLPHAPPAPFPFITPLFAYKDPLVAELVSSIKNRKNSYACNQAAYALLKKLPQAPSILVPIPLSRRRLRERGFNQCELIIDEIMKLDNGKYFAKRTDILIREKDSGEQKLKNKQERSNVENVFSGQCIALHDPIILIDDVVTTGYTLNEARNTLLRLGYAHISAFTLAH